MEHTRTHFWERMQVQVATAVALAVVYLLLWQFVRPWDPEGPITFLGHGETAPGVAFALIVWALAAACALATLRSRPEGGLLAALIGAAGVAMRSPQIRSLLWEREDFTGLFLRLIGEVVVLCVVVLGAAVIVGLVRRAVAKVRPQWLWQPPLADDGGQEKPDAKGVGAVSWMGRTIFPFAEWGYVRIAGRPGAKPGVQAMLVQCLSCLLLGLMVSAVLVLVLIQSPDRGQIIFAMLVSFAVGMLASHQLFPTPYSIVAWALPVLAAVLFYSLGIVSSVPGELGWTGVPYYARPLPVDWLTAGAGGGLLGFWISERIHELRHFEKSDKSE